MKLLFGVVLLAVSPLAAQQSADYARTPEQHHGQLAQLRLRLLYPVLLPVAARGFTADPADRLEEFLSDSGRALKNVDALAAYLREGLRDPRAEEGSREQWETAWRLLDGEIAGLRPIAARGESFMGGSLPAQSRFAPSKDGYRPLEDKPEFDSPEGLRLHRALVFAAYAENLREYLIRKSAAARAVTP